MVAVSVLLVIVALLAAIIVQLAAIGIIGRNSFAGIRTTRVRKNDASWRAGHRAGAPMMWLASVVSIALAVLSVTLPITEVTRDILLAASIAALLGFGSWATIAAGRAAEELTAGGQAQGGPRAHNR